MTPKQIRFISKYYQNSKERNELNKTIGMAAYEYEASKIMNIADLARISVNDVIETKTYGKGEDEFTIDVIVVDKVDHRVPVSVVAQLQALGLKEDVEPFEFFRVLKVGSTIQDTKYTVVPLYD